MSQQNIVDMDMDVEVPVECHFEAIPMNCDSIPITSSLYDQMLEWTMEMQAVWDEFRAPVEMQDKMMKMLFSGVQPCKGRKAMSRRDTKSLGLLLLSNGEKEIDKPLPQNLNQLFCHYQSLGMVEPQRWRLCVGSKERSHPPRVFSPDKEDTSAPDILRCVCLPATNSSRLKRDCSVCCMRCEECGNSRVQMVRFDYIPFMEQLKLLCRSSTNCHEFLAMWRGRNGWLGQSSFEERGNVKEFWDGEKVTMYQDFWNPNAFWEIPVICQNEKCKKIYRTFPVSMRCEKLSDGWNEERQEYIFRCSKCYSWIQSKKKIANGDPRNFALICHWDGFQAASTKQKDVGVLEMSIANANKGCKVGPLPLLFIPFSAVQLEQAHGDLLQHFLTPLMDDLFSSFMNGFVVDYNYPSSLIADGISNGARSTSTLRAILMLWTGDHPAQCKLGMFKDGGKNGCRRDCPSTTKVVQDRRIPFYVFGKNRYQARYPPPKRHVQDMHAAIKASKRETTKKAKKKALTKEGLTGESCLWRLYDLYGFDVSKDLVYDVMHVLALNVFKKYTKALFESSSNQQKKLLEIATQKATLAAPKSLRHQGRWPSKSPSKHHNMFTAEEHQKFVMWCLPHVLNTVTSISKEMKDLGMLLVDIAHIFYNHTRTHGWSKEDMEVTHRLLSAWRILTEETQGANTSPLEHVAGNAEMLDDIRRHGGHDCMWCYRYERSVHGYVTIPTNNKTNEVTYAKYQSRVLLTKVKRNMKMEEDGLLPGQRHLLSLHECLQKPEGMVFDKDLHTSCEEWHKQAILVATSEKLAVDIFKISELLDPCPCKELLVGKGVLVSPKKRNVRSMADYERDYLQSFWRNDLVINEVVSFAKVFLRGERYCIQDRVIVSYNHEQSKELCEINNIFAHEHYGSIEVFFTGIFANSGIEIDGLPTNEGTGMKLVSSLQLESICRKILPISHIRHKCFLLPSGGIGDHVVYEMQDNGVRKRLLEPGQPGCVPPWIEIGDVVLIDVHNNLMSLQNAVVRDVCHESHRVQLGIMCAISNDEWLVTMEEETWRDWNVCLKILSGWIPIEATNHSNANRQYQRVIRFRHISI